MPSPRRIGLAIEFHLPYKHHAGIFAGVQRYADERGWLTAFDDWIEESLATSPPGRPDYDGVIARVGNPQIPIIGATAAAGIPLVNVMAGSPAVDELPGVFPDFEKAGQLQAEHLIARGLRHFATLTTQERPTYACRASAFAATVEAAGYAISRVELREDLGGSVAVYRENQARIRGWMDAWQLPIGLAAPSDVFARLLAQLCHQRGWRIPEDVSIVGVMNEEMLCENVRPFLSSVEMGYERIGYEAARLLESLMDEAKPARRQGKTPLRGSKPKAASRDRRIPAPAPSATVPVPGGARHLLLPPVGVVVRESSDFYAAHDEVIAQAQAFIAERCHTHLEVSDVAEQVCVSVRTLQNRFAQILKRSVAKEIARARIEKVKWELMGTDGSVHDIASRAGFTSNARLCEVFKREVGMSPTEYRAERKVGEGRPKVQPPPYAQ